MTPPPRRRKKRVLRPCHDGQAFLEQVVLLDERSVYVATIGFVPCFANPRCYRPVGEVELKARVPKHWTPASWALMMEHHPHPPYNFKVLGDRVVPHTWVPGQKAPAAPPTTSAASAAAAVESAEIMAESEEFT